MTERKSSTRHLNKEQLLLGAAVSRYCILNAWQFPIGHYYHEFGNCQTSVVRDIADSCCCCRFFFSVCFPGGRSSTRTKEQNLPYLTIRYLSGALGQVCVCVFFIRYMGMSDMITAMIVKATIIFFSMSNCTYIFCWNVVWKTNKSFISFHANFSQTSVLRLIYEINCTPREHKPNWAMATVANELQYLSPTYFMFNMGTYFLPDAAVHPP